MNFDLESARVTVTGGAGFIGSNLVAHLLECGCEVTVLDNFATGKRENLAGFAGNKKFSLIEGDIRNMADCRRAVGQADFVLHQAALGSVPRSIKDPSATVEVNVAGFVNVLFAACEAKVKRFVYASSSSVYGDCQVSPKVENIIGRQLSPYAVTKRTDEVFAGNFHDVYGIDCIGLRYFNVFGQHQDPDGAYAAVIPKFAKALLRGESPVIYGDGSRSRDFTYVSNVVKANMLALGVSGSGALNQVYNIACGKTTDLNTLFTLIREKLSKYAPHVSAVTAVYAEPRPGDIPHSLADISKAEKLLGYSPDIDVRQGLDFTAGWYFKTLGK